jgi:hypothetical protein
MYLKTFNTRSSLASSWLIKNKARSCISTQRTADLDLARDSGRDHVDESFAGLT